MANESVTKEITNELAKYLRSNVAGIKSVETEWPSQNIGIQYPSITLFTKTSTFLPLDRFVHSRGLVTTTNKILTKWVVGQYDLSIQVDLWCENKEQRDDMYEAFFKGFNRQISPMGLSLQLKNYHSVWARYDVDSYVFDDTEEAAQRAEWRCRISLLAHVKAILESTDFAMVEFENNPQVSDNEAIQ